MSQPIFDFLKNNPRNKIVVSARKIENLNYLDIGKALSQRLIGVKSNKNFALAAKSMLNDLLSESVYDHQIYQQVLSLTNVGILLEPELKLDFLSLINNFSRENAVFLHWNGEIESNKIYFLSSQNGIPIDLTNLTHLTI